MRFCDLLESYIAPDFAGSEAESAVTEFKRHIPGRVLQIEFNAQRSNKQGIKDGQKIYKLGLDLSSSTVFIEYYDDCNQGQPTMAIFIDKAKPQILVSGWQIDKRMIIKFAVVNGEVKKAVQLSR